MELAQRIQAAAGRSLFDDGDSDDNEDDPSPFVVLNKPAPPPPLTDASPSPSFVAAPSPGSPPRPSVPPVGDAAAAAVVAAAAVQPNPVASEATPTGLPAASAALRLPTSVDVAAAHAAPASTSPGCDTSKPFSSVRDAIRGISHPIPAATATATSSTVPTVSQPTSPAPTAPSPPLSAIVSTQSRIDTAKPFNSVLDAIARFNSPASNPSKPPRPHHHRVAVARPPPSTVAPSAESPSATLPQHIPPTATTEPTAPNDPPPSSTADPTPTVARLSSEPAARSAPNFGGDKATDVDVDVVVNPPVVEPSSRPVSNNAAMRKAAKILDAAASALSITPDVPGDFWRRKLGVAVSEAGDRSRRTSVSSVATEAASDFTSVTEHLSTTTDALSCSISMDSRTRLAEALRGSGGGRAQLLTEQLTETEDSMYDESDMTDTDIDEEQWATQSVAESSVSKRSLASTSASTVQTARAGPSDAHPTTADRLHGILTEALAAEAQSSSVAAQLQDRLSSALAAHAGATTNAQPAKFKSTRAQPLDTPEAIKPTVSPSVEEPDAVAAPGNDIRTSLANMLMSRAGGAATPSTKRLDTPTLSSTRSAPDSPSLPSSTPSAGVPTAAIRSVAVPSAGLPTSAETTPRQAEDFRASLANMLQGNASAVSTDEDASKADSTAAEGEQSSLPPSPALPAAMGVAALASTAADLNESALDTEPLEYPSPLKALLGENNALWLSKTVIDLNVDVDDLTPLRRGGEAALLKLEPDDGVSVPCSLHPIQPPPRNRPGPADPVEVGAALLQAQLPKQLLLRSEMPTLNQWSKTRPYVYNAAALVAGTSDNQSETSTNTDAATRHGQLARALLLRLSPVVSLRHPHLVRVHGLCSTRQGLGLMLDTFPYTLHDLLHALRSGGDHRLKPTDRVDCAHQVASGLAALHRQGGVHLLLATHNVWMAKVGGRAHYALANPMILSWLGLASSECLMGAHSEYPGGSAALEVTLANQRGPLGKSADVFDFGLLMWQLASGLAVREGYPQKDLQRLTDEEALRVRPVVPVGLETDYVELMQQCWSTDKDRRPGMSAVVARLRQILRRLGKPAPKDTQRAEEEPALALKLAKIFKLETEYMLTALAEARTPPPKLDSDRCFSCHQPFSMFAKWRRHCVHCGHAFCQAHLRHEVPLPHLGLAKPQAVCAECLHTLPMRSPHATAVERSKRRPPELWEQSKCVQCKVPLNAAAAPHDKQGTRIQCEWCGQSFCPQHCATCVELPEYGTPKGGDEVVSTSGRLAHVCAPCVSDIRVHRGGLSDAARGDLLVALEYFSAAAPLLTAAVETAKRTVGRRDPAYTHALISVARCHMRQQRLDDARDAYKRLLAVQKHVLGPSHLLVATTTKELAECEMELGNKARAEKLHKAAVAVLEHNNGENDLSVAAALDARGELLLKAHRLVDAEACYTRALRIKQVAVGDSHPTVAAALYNLANVLDHSHQCQRALEVYKQAEAMVVSTSGADSPAACLARRKLAGAHMTLGELLQGDKQYVPAREQYEAALAMLEKVFGTQSDKVTPVLDSLGDLTRRMRLLEDSDAFYQRALTLRIDAHSRPTMAVGETLRNLGITAQCRGLYEQAEDFYVRALHIVSTGGSEMDASRQELTQTLIALRYAMGKN